MSQAKRIYIGPYKLYFTFVRLTHIEFSYSYDLGIEGVKDFFFICCDI